MAWIAGATFVNPSGGTVLADTGPLAKGYWRFQIVGTANTGTEVLLQYRDAANAVTLKQKTLPITFSTTFLLLDIVQQMLTNERLRIVQRADVTTGEVEVSIFSEMPDVARFQYRTPT